MAQGLDSLTPGQVVVGRLLAGAATLAAVVAVSRRPLPRDPALYGHLAVVGVLLCVLPFSLFARAQQYLPSGLASIYNATTPLMTAAVALAALPAERLGTGLAYVWNTGVVSAWGATAASTVTYLTPVVGVTLGVALRGERLAWHQPVGAVVVVLGSALSQGVPGRGVPGRVTFAPERARRAGARVRR